MKKLISVLLFILAMPALAQDRVSIFDQNQDGKVSYTEMAQRCQITKTLFQRADANGDGYLSNGEMRKAKGYLLVDCHC